MLMLRRMAQARQQGVSMIEVVVVMAVLSLVVFAVMPEVTLAMGNARVRAASESMLSGLQRARVEALRRNERVSLYLIAAGTEAPLDNTCVRSAAGLSWVVSIADPTGQCGADSSDTVDPRIKLKADGSSMSTSVTVAATDRTRATAANRITFDGSGRIADADGIRYIDLEHASGSTDMRKTRIEVTVGGVIRLCEPALLTTGSDPRRCLHAPSV